MLKLGRYWPWRTVSSHLKSYCWLITASCGSCDKLIPSYCSVYITLALFPCTWKGQRALKKSRNDRPSPEIPLESRANSPAPVRTCDVEGGAVYSKTSTFGSNFDGTALTSRLRSPTPIMAPAGIDFAHFKILVWNSGMVFEGTTRSEVVYEFFFGCILEWKSICKFEMDCKISDVRN